MFAARRQKLLSQKLIAASSTGSLLGEHFFLVLEPQVSSINEWHCDIINKVKKGICEPLGDNL